MADIRQREFISELIELYRSFPCLWRVKSKEYSDRDKKNLAYTVLLNKYKEIDETATKDSVKRKINSMRTVYRKELAKLNKSVRSGAGDEDVYKPTLWYFDLFQFLNDQETPRGSVNTMDSDAEEIDQVRRTYSYIIYLFIIIIIIYQSNNNHRYIL